MTGPTYTMALLAGGKSSRFGSDKALARIAGGLLWERQWRLLESLQPEKMRLSLRAPQPWVPEDFPVIYDACDIEGPLTAIAGLLDELATTHLLVLAVDLPAMTADFLRNLQRSARAGCGVVPKTERWHQGLCAIYPGECRTLAADCLASGDRSVQQFIRQSLAQDLLQSLQVAAQDAGCLANWNYAQPEKPDHAHP